MHLIPALLLLQVVAIEPSKFVMGDGDAPPRTKEEWKMREWDVFGSKTGCVAFNENWIKEAK